MLSRANIAYDLYKSPHTLRMVYNGQEIIYYFSSELYRAKFESRKGEQREKIRLSLYNRFGFTIAPDLISDLKLYSSIEKRGFLMSIDGEYVECLRYITLDGQRMTVKSSSEQ